MATNAMLEWPDYVILAVFLTISLGIGVYHSLTGGRQRTTSEFIMANRRLAVLPTALSMFSSYLSAISMLGLTAEMYMYGVQMMVWTPLYSLLGILITERLVIPWIYPLHLVSINDYLERRYASKAVRVTGSALGILFAIVYMSVAMYAPSVAMEAATGLSIFISIPLMAFVSIAYTALGGMRAVIWTDVFQSAAMIGGMVAIMIKGIVLVGGFSNVLEICVAEGRMQLADWNPDPRVRHTVWTLTFGYGSYWVSVLSFSQASVQRYSGTKSLQNARLIAILTFPPFVVLQLLCCITGLAVFAYFARSGCDPLVNHDVNNPNQLLPHFVMMVFSGFRGFAGFFLASLYGGALSSVSSSLSGAAANCWDDILKFKLSEMSEHRKALTNRLLVVVFGVLAAALAFLSAMVPGPVTQIGTTLLGAVGGPVSGLFIMGGISKHANWKGAITGSLCGILLLAWINLGRIKLDIHYPTLPLTSVDRCLAAVTNDTLPWEQYNVTSDWLTTPSVALSHGTQTHSGLAGFYSISYLWNTIIGAAFAIVVGLSTSLLFRDRKAEEEVDERLLIPFRQCLCWNVDVNSTSSRLHQEHYEPVDTHDHKQEIANCDEEKTELNDEQKISADLS